MEKVVVVMAVYNGEKFLKKQIDSILSQEKCDIEIHVGENGSSDSSPSILDEYSNRGQVSRIVSVPKLGFTNTFFKMMKQVEDGNYIAFSDQDDIWESEKLTKLMDLMPDNAGAALIFSKRSYIDVHGKVFGAERIPSIDFSWGNAIIQNIVPGNTMLLNPDALHLLKSLGQPEVKYYDSWIYLVMTLFGKIIYTEDELVMYRIHSGNAVGIRKSFNISNTLDAIDEYIKQAKIIGSLAADRKDLVLPKSFTIFLERILDKRVWIRISIIFQKEIRRQSFFETILFKLGMIWCLVFRKS